MTETTYLRVVLLALAIVLIAGCKPEKEDEPQLAEGVYAPLGEVLPSATDAQKQTFDEGRAVAIKRFSPEDGLGPTFNVTFCASCHEKPVIGGSAPRYRNFFLTGALLEDGSHIPLGQNGVQNTFRTDGSHVTNSEGTNHQVTRNPIPFFGTGLLAEIPEENILIYADEDDADGDGISGRPNYDRGFVGRFGRKAQTVSIEGFIRGPLFNHLGITSNPLSNELKAQLPIPSVAEVRDTRGSFIMLEQGQAAAPDEPNFDDDGVPDPELSEDELFALVSFSMLLAAPEPSPPNVMSKAGLERFVEIGCDGCHVTALEGPRGLIPAYTDLLLHDMGPDMDDGITMGVAKGSEFRTAPLWGIAAVGPYLHDGRADTLHDAIRMHGGEAEAVRDAYMALDSTGQAEVIAFLTSLGGAEQMSSGLMKPNQPVPPAGEYGGPVKSLSAEEEARFVAGREVFDRDEQLAAGLGPNFNGDSCRACHFDPVIGGAGSLGVNVTRKGILDTSGTYADPPGGTMLHRFSINGNDRPLPEPEVTHFEFRQTPSILGIGLIDRIPEDTIRANADPDDTNGDGISGRVHVLSDGRVGRFGWKGDVPSVEEFMRDALSNEVGMSLPERTGTTFGLLTDGDEVADPEFSDQDYDALLFFLQTLAPPPRTRNDNALEDAGEQVFASVGCDGCHTPSMTTADGVEVPLYSDLLLHDVAAPDAKGIAAGDASMHEFRTPPLWGIATSAPYMHTGLASTLPAAIEAHHGEADGVRQAYEALSDSDRDALIAFLRSL